jgi:hypothetical protein
MTLLVQIILRNGGFRRFFRGLRRNGKLNVAMVFHLAKSLTQASPRRGCTEWLMRKLLSAIVGKQIIFRAAFLYNYPNWVDRTGQSWVLAAGPMVSVAIFFKVPSALEFSRQLFQDSLAALLGRSSPLTHQKVVKVLKYFRSPNLLLLCALAKLLGHELGLKSSPETIMERGYPSTPLTTFIKGLIALRKRDFVSAKALLLQCRFPEAKLELAKATCYGSYGVSRVFIKQMLECMIKSGVTGAQKPYLDNFILRACGRHDINTAITDLDQLAQYFPSYKDLRTKLLLKLHGTVTIANTQVRHAEQDLQQKHADIVEAEANPNPSDKDKYALERKRKRVCELHQELAAKKQNAADCKAFVDQALVVLRATKKAREASASGPAKRAKTPDPEDDAAI